jgi:uncharacterized protein (PEP-CTERM system associated)
MLLVAAALATGRAEAQPSPWQPDRLSPGWVFTPSMVVGGLWDSNVTVRNQGNPLIREWVGIVNPRGELDYNGRQLRFNTGYSGALEAYRNVSELNRYEQKARVLTQYRASARLQAVGRASYTITPTTDRLELGTLPFVDFGGRMFDASSGVTYATTPRTQIAGEYRFQHVTFDRDQNVVRNTLLQGGYAHSPVVTVRHSLTERIAIGADWQYRRAIIAGGTQHFDVQSTLGEVSYQISPSTSVVGAAGASHLAIANTDVSMWGPALRAGLEHQVERTRLTVHYSKSFVPSFSFGGLAGNQEVTGSVRMPLTRTGRLEFNASVSYSRAEPVAALGVGYGLDSWWTNWSLGYMVSPWLRTEGFLSTMHQTSTIRGNIDRTRVGIQFVTFKPVRIQ